MPQWVRSKAAENMLNSELKEVNKVVYVPGQSGTVYQVQGARSRATVSRPSRKKEYEVFLVMSVVLNPSSGRLTCLRLRSAPAAVLSRGGLVVVLRLQGNPPPRIICLLRYARLGPPRGGACGRPRVGCSSSGLNPCAFCVETLRAVHGSITPTAVMFQPL